MRLFKNKRPPASSPDMSSRNASGRRRRGNRRPVGARTFQNVLTNLVSSPWRPITFTVELAAPVGSWGRIKNPSIVKALESHLGFTPTNENYLEVRYKCVSLRRQEAGTALSLRLYRVENSPTSSNTNPVAVESEVESYATSSIAFPHCYLAWSRFSSAIPITAKEDCPIFAIYPHLGVSSEVVLAVVKMWYRHAATPFESEDTRSVKLTVEAV